MAVGPDNEPEITMIRPASADEPTRSRRKLLMQALITAALVLAFVAGLWALVHVLGKDEHYQPVQDTPGSQALP